MDPRISIVDLQNSFAEKSLLTKCAELYCKIWREPPWNEHFWKAEDVKKDIVNEISKTAGKCLIATLDKPTGSEIIGFTWGYMANPEYLLEISGSDYFINNCKSLGNIFYVDELGVDPRFRKSGIGKKLSEKLISHAKKSGANFVTLRTNKKAMPARKLYNQLGFRELLIQDKQHTERTYWILCL